MLQVIVHVAGGATRVFSSFEGPFTIGSLQQRLAIDLSIPVEQQHLTTLGGRSLASHCSSYKEEQLENFLEGKEVLDDEEALEAHEELLEVDEEGSQQQRQQRVQQLQLEHGQVVSCVFKLCGGKGGFGSMLRSQGAKMKAKGPANFSACRDLSGRRLKIVEDAKL